MASEVTSNSYERLVLTESFSWYCVLFLIILNGLRAEKSFEDLDLDEQLKILNKPYVKSIKTKEGEIFHCVNITEQPAFDHPLLQNHKIQMRPSFDLKKTSTRSSSLSSKLLSKRGITPLNCPFGTVPIRKTTKEDLINAKQFKRNLMSYIHPTAAKPAGFHYAIQILRMDPSRKCMGAVGEMSLHNLTVTKNQFSETFVRIQGSSDDHSDVIQAGWMVNPTLLGDNLTRTFALWTNGKSGCFNIFCPGFVQVNMDYNVNLPITHTSTYGVQQEGITITIFQDKETGNWWLHREDQFIGYWPKSLFTHLSSSSVSVILWGGGAFSSNGEASPPMGSGHFAEEEALKAAAIAHLQTVDESNKLRTPERKSLQFYSDERRCYTINPTFYIQSGALAFYYGGPGGNCGN